MPDSMTNNYSRLFIAGLERWETPFGERDKGTEGLSNAAVAERFVKGLERWEWPMRGSAREVVTIRDQSLVALMQPLWLEVKSTIEVIAERTTGAWAGLPVLVEKVGGGLVRATRLNASGIARFTDVAPGEYYVIASPVSGGLGSYGAVLLGAELRGDDKPVATAQESTFSVQGVNASVKIRSNAEISITFTTVDRKLAGGLVRLAFADRETGWVQLSGEAELEAQPGDVGRWAGLWRYGLPIARDCELLFSVGPRK